MGRAQFSECGKKSFIAGRKILHNCYLIGKGYDGRRTVRSGYRILNHRSDFFYLLQCRVRDIAGLN